MHKSKEEHANKVNRFTTSKHFLYFKKLYNFLNGVNKFRFT